MNELTVVIPFLNEGNEVEITIREIKRTAGDAVDIVLVNDASDDGFDYKSVAERYGTLYVEHSDRLGSGPAKQAGINACQTPYFLVIDGHMRFYHDDWWLKIVSAIKEDPRAIYCCRCKSWSFDKKAETGCEPPYAAYFKALEPKERAVVNVAWVTYNIYSDTNLVDVPCVLGACYAATKEYWNYLRGFEGLRLYGCEEAYISLKAWMEGGRCRLLTDVVIGHLFRNKFPYVMDSLEIFYNKMFIAETVLPEVLRRKVIRAMKGINYINYVRAAEMMKERQEEVENLRGYYSDILTAGYDNFCRINDAVADKINAK